MPHEEVSGPLISGRFVVLRSTEEVGACVSMGMGRWHSARKEPRISRHKVRAFEIMIQVVRSDQRIQIEGFRSEDSDQRIKIALCLIEIAVEGGWKCGDGLHY
jgi:hypothetical protein